MTDNAGNIGKSAEDKGGTQIATPSANTNPYNLTTSSPTNLRTTTSLTITASATDNEQTTLYYDLYWNGSSTVTQTVQGTRENTVTFTARTGLTKRTSYSWRIVVRDGVGGTCNGSSTSAYTNCDGGDFYCAGGASNVCNRCKGLGSLTGCHSCFFESGTFEGECANCGALATCVKRSTRCSICKLGASWNFWQDCAACGTRNSHFKTIGGGITGFNCPSCDDGKIDVTCVHR